MKVEISKRYRHYKGQEYTVLHIGRLESDPETQCVIYRAEYTSPDFGPDTIWVRPIRSFEESIEVEGELVQRFTKIDAP